MRYYLEYERINTFSLEIEAESLLDAHNKYANMDYDEEAEFMFSNDRITFIAPSGSNHSLTLGGE